MEEIKISSRGRDQPPESKVAKNTLFLKNLSEQATEEDIQAVFDAVLPDVQVFDVRIIRDEHGKRKCIGFVDVETKEMAEKSLKINNYNIKGKAVQVYLSKPPKEGD